MAETTLERMAKAQWEAREATFPERLRMSWASGSPLARTTLLEQIKQGLLAIRTPTMDAGLIGAPIITQHMKGNADYCAACDSFTAIIDAILEGKA